jgi:hypothetical protein
MNKIRWLLLLGGVLIAVAGVSLAINSVATVEAFEVMNVKVTDTTPSPPAALAQLAMVAGFAGLLAVGWIVACGGISAPVPGRRLTVPGRLCYAAAGLVTMVSTVPLILGSLVLRHAVVMLATSESAPTADQLDAIIAATRGYGPVGFAIGTVAGLLVILAACVGFRDTDSSPAGAGPSPKSYVITGMTAALAILFGVFFLFVSRHGAALSAVVLNSATTPKASELAGHLMGILSKSLAAYVCLTLVGGTQVLTAILAPAQRGDP